MLLLQPNSARGRLRSKPLNILISSLSMNAPVTAELSAWTASFGFPGYFLISLRSKPLEISKLCSLQ